MKPAGAATQAGAHLSDNDEQARAGSGKSGARPADGDTWANAGSGKSGAQSAVRGTAANAGSGKTGAQSAVRGTMDRLFTLILVSVMFVGIVLLSYPTVANYWNSFHQSNAVMSYAEHVSNMKEEEYERLLQDAEAYNKKVSESGIKWQLTDEERAEYNSELNFEGTGVMGYITIQKIDVILPIYHGTDDKVLQNSIGHLEGSSLPVGGEGSNCLLSGHRGLPSARLFTDLNVLTEGDTFTLTILNETLTYEVDHIWIVEPKDLTHLQIRPGQDLCTLITCTPYGINTHRLLVQGHRIENADGDALIIADALRIRPVYIAPFLAIPIIAVLLIYLLISTSSKSRSTTDYKAMYMREHGLKEAKLPRTDRGIPDSDPEDSGVEDSDQIPDTIREFIDKLQ